MDAAAEGTADPHPSRLLPCPSRGERNVPHCGQRFMVRPVAGETRVTATPASDEQAILSGPAVPAQLRDVIGETLVELLDLAAARTPDDVAIVMRHGADADTWRYAELVAASRRVAATLAGAGVTAGDRVLTWASNDPWLVAAYFGLWRLGAAVVPLDLRMSLDVAARIGRAAGATLLLAGPAISTEQVESIELPSLQVSHAGLDPDPDRQPDLPPTVVEPATLAEILFTSGTTSDPKGVMITHGQMIHSVRAIALTAGGLHRERALALIPLSHAYGQMVPLFYGLVTGSQITFIAAMTPARLLDALRRDAITAVTVVPQFLEILMDRIEGEAGRRGALARLRRIRSLALAAHLPIGARRWLFRDVLASLGGGLSILSCGGARLPRELQLAWEGLGVIVVQGYGATECSAIAGHDRRNRRPGTVGPPLAGIQVRIAPDGELLARGPNAMSGYWRRPAETAEVLEGGWVHTGDAATVDSHGELVILGRTRDRIALPNGMKVYPEDVERPLVAQEAIRAAVVLEGAPGQLIAVLVPAAEATTDVELDAAVTAANDALAQHQRVRRWRRWPDADFPRTHTFKVRRSEVAGWYAAGTGGGTVAAAEGGAS